MSDLSNTQFFQVEPGPQISAKDILEIVYKALKGKRSTTRLTRSWDTLCQEILLTLPAIMEQEA